MYRHNYFALAKFIYEQYLYNVNVYSIIYSISLLCFQDTVEVVKKFMARDPDAINFNVVALAAKS